MDKPAAFSGTLHEPYRGSQVYGVLALGTGTLVSENVAGAGAYTAYDLMWDLVHVGGDLNDYWPEGTTAGTSWNYWGTYFFHNFYWGAGDGADWSLVSVTGTGAWSLVAKPS